MSARWRPAIFLVLPGSLPPYRSPALSIFVTGGWIDHLSTLRELFHDDKSSTSKLINYCNRYLLCLVQVRERCSLSGLVTSQRVTNQPLRNSLPSRPARADAEIWPERDEVGGHLSIGASHCLRLRSAPGTTGDHERPLPVDGGHTLNCQRPRRDGTCPARAATIGTPPPL